MEPRTKRKATKLVNGFLDNLDHGKLVIGEEPYAIFDRKQMAKLITDVKVLTCDSMILVTEDGIIAKQKKSNKKK